MNTIVNKIGVMQRSSLHTIAFFLAGFNLASFYLPAILAIIFLDFKNILKERINKNYMVVSFLFSLFVLSVFSIGYNELKMGEPYKVLIIILVEVSILGLIIQSGTIERSLRYIISYMFGVTLQSFVIVLSSFASSDSYGYNKLLDPFSGELINSPSVSNSLSLGLVMIMYLFITSNTLKKKLIYSTIMTILVLSGLYLAGRTFFLISAMGFLYIMLKHAKIKTFVYTTVLFIIAYVIVNTVFYSEIYKYLQFTIERFSNGFESNRFAHAMHWFSVIGDYPFGGFGVNQSIESTHWYHNILFDSSRVAGWAPVLLFVMYVSSVLFVYINEGAAKQKTLPFILFILALIVSFQDVVIEGNYRILMIIFFSSVVICKNSRCETNT
ncbi:hypothetical protein HBA43_09015 [Providencia rettgeri]|uniref:hypothetical protein n=1 Tax=Providencia rettgeri TaxID=587 RepID=UPI001419ED33|nr:hypothetical protein [Providencia rettgeri]NIA76679.1 hypothetical protein [Providencia rettgeri]NIA78543.1 hypothetical protein [Providencia rettgeri]NIB01744.1 hypothetical protein [Providencia rettgeri]NIB05909.1 hypothetical protein [Providencia rettgeri]NIB19443.1 hypothetical protein [Providencia rettgeri]